MIGLFQVDITTARRALTETDHIAGDTYRSAQSSTPGSRSPSADRVQVIVA